jgi:hypothetical protein
MWCTGYPFDGRKGKISVRTMQPALNVQICGLGCFGQGLTPHLGTRPETQFAGFLPFLLICSTLHRTVDSLDEIFTILSDEIRPWSQLSLFSILIAHISRCHRQ